MDFLRQLYQQFVGIWRSLSLQQRIFVGFGSALAFAGLLLLTLWQTTPQYNVLFGNLQERDAGEVVTKLKELEVPYKLSDDGTTVMIPSNRVAETRLALAQEGLPRGGGVGYEIFDRTRLGITSFEQKVNLKRATEGELARTINQLNEVQWSRVQIVMPEERLFTEQQQEPSASVFLNLFPGRSLSRRQIQGIQHMVASSVEGLRPENITILDQHANPLAMPTETFASTAELSSSQFEMRSRVEKYFQDKLKSMFDRILGPRKSVISVSVDLDFDSIERTEEKYDPDGAVVRSEQRQRESTTSPSAQPEGVAGISANLPSVAPLTPASYVGSQRQSTSSITNFEISKTVEHIIKSPSSIKSISVAVVVDGTYQDTTAPDGTRTREYTARSEEEIDKYKRMVLAAVGNPTAGNIEVINVPLDTSAAEAEQEAAAAAAQTAQRRDLYLAIGKGVVTIAVLLFIFLLVRFVLRSILAAMPVRPASEKAGRRIDMLAKEESDATAEVKDMVDKRPEDVASLIKVWLKEEK
ncbi:MAG: flagellar M-ring protein FliF [Candidatus Abyssobacteria bacterium SURF_17]|uniref:Flagellar M-ring protein n=1 Tax=Candidatus Abyssobacteria bacterium SURF_17 TaxID=2093361 RepID=A0A419F4S3_9BACT|nr:MAG: flagellar M-ring protein FliF [Candidatus Abyssubacteria bacterium SURF_17]